MYLHFFRSSDVGMMTNSLKALRKSLDPRSTAKTVVKHVFFLNQNTKVKRKKANEQDLL